MHHFELLPREASSPAQARHYSAWSEDVDEHALSQRDFSLRYDQITAGAFQGSVQIIQLPGLTLVHEFTNRGTRQRGLIGQGQYGFAMPYHLERSATFNGLGLSPNAIMMGRSEDLDLCSVGALGVIGLVVDADLLRSFWQTLYHKPYSAWLENQVVCQASVVKAHELQTLHLQVLQKIEQSPSLLADSQTVMRLRDDLLFQWIETIPETVDLSDLKTVARRKKLVDRACEVALSHQDQPFSMLELCRRIGTSQRRLEYCFKDILGITPSQYLRTMRLNAVHRALKESNGQQGIHDIAARWGFWSASDFSSDFKRQFGKLPSSAVKKSASCVANTRLKHH